MLEVGKLLTERYVTSDAAGGGDGSIGDPWTLTEAIAGYAAGDRVNILSGTYTRAASDTLATSGTIGSPAIFRGVSSFSPLTPAYVGRLNGGALITTGMPVIAYGAYQLLPSGSYIVFDGISFTSTHAQAIYIGAGVSQSFYNCLITNISTRTNGRCIKSDRYGHILSNCDLSLSGGSNVDNVMVMSGGSAHAINCRIFSASGGSTGCAILNVSGCIFYSLSGGLQSSSDDLPRVDRSTFYNCASFGYSSVNAQQIRSDTITNCVFVSCGRAIYNPYTATAQHMLNAVNNAYYNNTNANLGFGDWPEQGRIDLAADPFVNAATGDFRIKDGSEAIGAALGGGDVGAIQRPENYRLFGLKLSV